MHPFSKVAVAADLKTRQGLKQNWPECGGPEDCSVAADLKTRQGLKPGRESARLGEDQSCSGLENPTGIETVTDARA